MTATVCISDDPLLRSTALIDSDHPAVVDFARRHAVGPTTRDRAVSLYLAVRDGFRYDPYGIDLSQDGMKASQVLANGVGWCVTKASLLAAACRASGIPARVGYADVRNHLSTERMRELLGTDLFMWHGYAELLLDGAWRKATPAFNIELCERFGLLPLEFNGREDSLYQPFDRAGSRHMEYVLQRGSFDEVPLATLRADFELHYPKMMAHLRSAPGDDFLAEAAHETRSCESTSKSMFGSRPR